MKKMFSMMLALALSLSFTACDAGLGAKQPSNDGAGNDEAARLLRLRYPERMSPASA